MWPSSIPTLMRGVAYLKIGLALTLACGAAMADVVAVVSSTSSVPPLTRTQIEEIFLGKVGRFPDGSIAVPLDLIEGSSGRDVFYAKLGKSPSQLKAYWSKIIFTGRGQPPRTVANGTEMKKRVAENPDAIGYIDAKLVDDTVRVLF